MNGSTPRAMLLDLITLGRFARELDEATRGRRVDRVAGDGEQLTLSVDGAPEHALQVIFGPPGALRLVALPQKPRPDEERSLRYLLGARVESVACRPDDRVLEIRLSRRDAGGALTYATLHAELIPPRFRLSLVSERHGRVLAGFAAAGDRRAPDVGDRCVAGGGDAPRRLPAALETTDWEGLLAAAPTVADAVRQRLAGADRHVTARLCAAAGLAPDAAPATLDPGVAQRLCCAARRLYAGPFDAAFRWDAGGGRFRVSVLEPEPADGVERFASVGAALRAPLPTSVADGGGRPRRQRRRLVRALAALDRRRRALESDLDEARQAQVLERAGSCLLAAGDSAATGPGRVEVADLYDPSGRGRVAVDLQPGESVTTHAGRLLKRARRCHRRLDLLPPRLQRLRDDAAFTRVLLARLEAPGSDGLTEEEMEHWERRLELRTADGEGRRDRTPGGAAAHPRRYRTSAGWSVWAGRNNRENDVLTHRMAAQNDIWFHAHGYAGSHVILRREGRKEEPSRSTLEEAAAVAAYWSKGRTASKVPVVYTLAKYVSKPRGGAPGLAVMKREKTLMVRPCLLPPEGEAPDGGAESRQR